MSSVGSPPVNPIHVHTIMHVPCPTCVDRIITESEVAGCGFMSTEPHVCSKNHLLGSSKSMLLVLKWWSRQWITIKSSTPQWVAMMIPPIRANCKLSYKDLQLQNSLSEWPRNNSGAKKQSMDAFHYTSKSRFSYPIPPTEFVSSFAPASWCPEAQNAMQD